MGIANNDNARLGSSSQHLLLANIAQDIKSVSQGNSTSQKRHHLDSKAAATRHREMHIKLLGIFEEKSNIFEDLKEDSIFNMVSNASMPPATHDQMLGVEKIGQALNEEFVQERLLVNSKVSIWVPLKLAKLPNFTLLNKKAKIRGKDRIIELPGERELFSRFALMAQSQRGLAMN